MSMYVPTTAEKQNITDEIQQIIEAAREVGQLSIITTLLQIAKRYNKDGWIIQAQTIHEVANEIIQKHQIKTKE